MRPVPWFRGVCRANLLLFGRQVAPLLSLARAAAPLATRACVAFLVVGCAGSDACPGAELSCGALPPNYQDVAPIIERRCLTCHSAESTTSRKRLDEYARVLGYAAAMEEQLLSCSMPRSGGMPAEERRRLLEWLACGAPQ